MKAQKWKIKKVYPITGRKDFFKYTIQSNGILAKDWNSKDMFFDDLKQAKIVCKAKNKVSRMEVIIYTTESGTKYTFNDVLELTKGNKSYAEILLERVKWQHIETLIEEDLMYDEIKEIDGTYILIN